jgi:uncharacterized iron-regulated protein
MSRRRLDRMNPAPLALLLGLAAVSAGCATGPPVWSSERSTTPAASIGDDPRALPMFAARSEARGRSVDWPALLEAVAWADVILLGEQHDDERGHAVELAVVQDSLRLHPRAALSMEMLERDDQGLVDDYLEGIIDAATLARLTHSTNWGGPGKWEPWYAPMIDAAKAAGAPIVAANAPRRYVRLAREKGYARLDSLPQPRRSLAVHPGSPPDGPYRQRFFKLMSGEDSAQDSTEPADGAHQSLTPAQVQAMFASQSVWDATMADSILRALARGASKIIHVVGQFHSDFDGGIVIHLRKARPSLRILTISLQRDDATDGLRESDRGRADIVIYTGGPPARGPGPDEDATQEADIPSDDSPEPAHPEQPDASRQDNPTTSG